MRIETRELSFLRKVAAVNDAGSAYHLNATARTQLKHQSRMIGALIGHGLLEERALLSGTEQFFSDRSRSYVLHITPLGRECCHALRAKVTGSP
jgi:hypothetical protein